MRNCKDMISAAEFARRVRFSSNYIYTLIKSGKLTPRVSFTGRKYFLEEDVIAFLKGEKVPVDGISLGE